MGWVMMSKCELPSCGVMLRLSSRPLPVRPLLYMKQAADAL